MTKDPRQRYQSAADMRDDLARFLAHEPILAKPPTVLEHALRVASRHRMELGATTLGVGALWAGVAVSNHAAAARTLGSLSVSAHGRDGLAVSGTAALQLIDPITGQAGEPRALGRLPVRGKALEPGYYRIVLDLAGGQRRILPRTIEAQEEVAVEAQVRPDQESREGMVLIQGGTLALRDEVAPYTLINRRDLPIAAIWMD